MKKSVAFTVTLILLLSLALSACGKKEPEPDIAGMTLGSYTLEDIKKLGYVVYENNDITSGQDAWNSFLKRTKDGKSATVRYAEYYEIDDPSHYEESYYEEIRDEYPVVYVHELSYDGKSYTDVHYENGNRYEKEYRYMLRFTGKPSSGTASFSSYTYYILTDDTSLTWEKCEESMFSSDSADYIDFTIVYSDLVK